jgi:hypothetical protein
VREHGDIATEPVGLLGHLPDQRLEIALLILSVDLNVANRHGLAGERWRKEPSV